MSIIILNKPSPITTHCICRLTWYRPCFIFPKVSLNDCDPQNK